MTTAKMIKEIRILEIIIICILAKTLYGRAVNTIPDDEINEQKIPRTKRGYSDYGGNGFGSSVHVSSGVLQYSNSDDHSSVSSGTAHAGGSDFPAVSADHVGDVSQYDSSATSADHWSASGLSSGYEVWLEPTPDYHASPALESSSSAIHPGSDHIVNTVFSDDSIHSADFQLPSSQLHTKIASGSIQSDIHGHDALAISDNIDFNNFADTKTKHYAKSYGK